jgi:hypothetical protein
MSRKNLMAAAMGSGASKSTSIALEDHSLGIWLVSNEQLVKEIDRAADLRMGLASLSSMVHSLESATPENVALIRIAANLALAGTRFDADHLVSSESISVSAETMSESAKAIFQRIIEAVKKAMLKIREFFTAIAGDVERVRRINTAVANNAKGKNGRSHEYTVTVRLERQRLEIVNKLPRSAPDLLRGLKELHRQLTIVTSQFSKNVEEAGTGIAAAISKDPGSGAAYKSAVDDAYSRIDFKALGSLLNVRTYNDIRFVKDEMKSAPPLMGNVSIFINDHGNGDVTKRHASLTLSTTTQSASVGTEVSYDTIPAADMIPLTVEIATILNTIKSHQENMVNKLTSKNTEIVNAAVGAQEHPSRLTATSTDQSLYASVDRIPNAYYKASQSLQSQLCHHVIMVCKAVLSLCDLSLRAHS